MNSRRGTPSGEGRGRSRGDQWQGASPRGRSSGAAAGRPGRRGGDNARAAGGRTSEREAGRDYRGGSRGRYGRTAGDERRDRGARSSYQGDRDQRRPGDKRDSRGGSWGDRDARAGSRGERDFRSGRAVQGDRDFRSDRRDRDDRAQGRGRGDSRTASAGRPADRSRPSSGSEPRSRRGTGRAGRARDEVRTIGGGAARRTGGRSDTRGKGRAVPADWVPAENPFKTSRQPLRDPDFYDEDYTDERDTTEVPGGERLQKVLAKAGVASRRACEEMIGQGRVTVDGQVVRRFGARVDPTRQVIHVDGKRIPTASELVYFALNKPIGVVSTMDDPEGRPCLNNYVQDLAPRLFHVGRLDTETEGLLLFTNDGELAHRLTHPSYGVPKKYWAKVPGPIPRGLHRVLRAGVELEDGLARADAFRVVQEHGQQALVEIVLHEGRTHVVRRMMEAVGHRVIDLARIEFGPVKLGRLKPGTVRALTLQEVGELYAAVGL